MPLTRSAPHQQCTLQTKLLRNDSAAKLSLGDNVSDSLQSPRLDSPTQTVGLEYGQRCTMASHAWHRARALLITVPTRCTTALPHGFHSQPHCPLGQVLGLQPATLNGHDRRPAKIRRVECTDW